MYCSSSSSYFFKLHSIARHGIRTFMSLSKWAVYQTGTQYQYVLVSVQLSCYHVFSSMFQVFAWHPLDSFLDHSDLRLPLQGFPCCPFPSSGHCWCNYRSVLNRIGTCHVESLSKTMQNLNVLYSSQVWSWLKSSTGKGGSTTPAFRSTSTSLCSCSFLP